ncbi:hypothetical protein N9273_00345 [bacterium]|nr:hypothetical protein [bacterium]
MQTFKEYFKSDPMMDANSASAKKGSKSFMRAGRKHENLIRKEYQHKCPHVRNLINGGNATIKLMGHALKNALQTYGMEFEQGTTKGIGNSAVEINMITDADGDNIGFLRKKDK